MCTPANIVGPTLQSLFLQALHLKCWSIGSFCYFKFKGLVLSFVKWTYKTSYLLVRSHISISYSASVKGTVANSMLFVPVPCTVSINKNFVTNFGSVRVRILQLSPYAVVNNLMLNHKNYQLLSDSLSLDSLL